MEKLKSFIENIDKNQKWREKFSDDEECNKISKQLLYIVNSCDDDNKLKLIGMAFNYFVNGEISKDEYFYTVNIISKSFYPYLKMVLEIDESDKRFKNDGTKYDYFGIRRQNEASPPASVNDCRQCLMNYYSIIVTNYCTDLLIFSITTASLRGSSKYRIQGAELYSGITGSELPVDLCCSCIPLRFPYGQFFA